MGASDFLGILNKMNKEFCIFSSDKSAYFMWSPAYKLHLKYFVKLNGNRWENSCPWCV